MRSRPLLQKTSRRAFYRSMLWSRSSVSTVRRQTVKSESSTSARSQGCPSRFCTIDDPPNAAAKIVWASIGLKKARKHRPSHSALYNQDLADLDRDAVSDTASTDASKSPYRRSTVPREHRKRFPSTHDILFPKYWYRSGKDCGAQKPGHQNKTVTVNLRNSQRLTPWTAKISATTFLSDKSLCHQCLSGSKQRSRLRASAT